MQRLVKVLSSLWLTIPILVAIIGVMIATTLGGGMDAATGAIRGDLYGSWWFNALLAALAVNVSVCTLKRKPFNLVMLGYLVTHIGILTVLAAAFVTNVWKEYGQITLFEGDRDRTFLYEAQRGIHVEVQRPDGSVGEYDHPFDLNPYVTARTDLEYRMADDRLALRVRSYEPHVTGEEGWEAAPEGEGRLAVRFSLQFPRGTMSFWGPLDEAVELGGPGLTWTTRRLRADVFDLLSLRSDSEPPALIVRYGGEVRAIDPEGERETLVTVGGAQVRVRSLVPIYSPGDELPPEHADFWANPAVEFEFKPPDGVIRRYVSFARRPELAPIDVESGDLTDLFDAVLVCRVTRSEVSLFALDDGSLAVAMTGREGGRMVQRVRVGEAFSFAFMGALTFTIDEALPSARWFYRVQPTPQRANEPANSAIEVELDGADGSAQGWVDLRRTSGRAFAVGDSRVVVRFGHREGELPFDVSLDDFVEEHYPGTNNVRRWESRITIVDRELTHREEHVVAVNEPAKYRGWVLYQASYITPEMSGRPEWGSVLAVSRDPGKPLLYAGAVFGVLGILYMFYVKPVVVRRRMHAATRADQSHVPA